MVRQMNSFERFPQLGFGRPVVRRTAMRRLLGGSSVLALGLLGTMQPAQAQVARMQAWVGTTVTTQTTTAAPRASVSRTPEQAAELAAQGSERAAIASMRGLVTAARAAANAATAAIRANPTDGLSLKGLNPAVGTVTASSADSTGLATWQGASLPTQSVSGDTYTVTVKQTDNRALLSWNSFDIGAKTTLVFDQSLNGVNQSSWVVVNRVVDPHAAASTILGQIKAPGTVVVINRAGVIFGAGSQVNTNSLLASSLDIGNFGKDVAGAANRYTGLSIKERNDNFLQNGLLVTSASALKYNAMLTSSLAGSGSYDFTNPSSGFSSTLEGSVEFDRGATVTAGTGGFIIATAPSIVNDGALTAYQGQVSLQAGRAITYTVSTGATNSADSDIRGLILRSAVGSGGNVTNSGLIDARQSYVSLGSDLTGSVTNAGLIASTTSVSRNAVVSLTAGTVTLSGGDTVASASGISIQPDSDGETVPQGTAADPPVFKQSRIDIGAEYVPVTAIAPAMGAFGTGNVVIGQNALILAPNANVQVGGTASADFNATAIADTGQKALPGSISIASGAVIDVSGIKDLTLDATRNQVTISPLKGNELRDTPNYRSISTTGAFTLNGQSVTIDPRVSGVRADGVAWVGSPLIEAGSAVSQIAVTAAELMTKGGTVTLKVAPLLDAASPLTSQRIDIAKGAVIDFSGGWVHYNAGAITTTRLIRADGTIVDIADADPNGVYVGIAGSTQTTDPKTGKTTSYTNGALGGTTYDPAYDEGRDAGALIIATPTGTIDGTFHGDAFAGLYQVSNATVGTKTATIATDRRALQATAYQLPSAGYLRIGAFNGGGGVSLGGDILVNAGQGKTATATAGAIQLSDAQLDAAHLAQLSLQTSGAVTLASGSNVTLANGGRLQIDAGRTIALDGNVTVRSGTIAARTYEIGGTLLQSSFARIGSAFTTDDDVQLSYAIGADLPSLFDVVVGGTLDVSGVWSNDQAAALSGTNITGSAFTNGGSISLAVAPNVFVGQGASLATAKNAVDLSGNLLIAPKALLNVAAGGYVASTGVMTLNAKGGNVTLLDETIYASTVLTDPSLDINSVTDQPIGSATQSVTFTPYTTIDGVTVRSSLVVAEQRSKVSFAASNFDGFSFDGGGAFTLVAPNVSFGSTNTAGSAHLGLDFLQQTGFGTLAVSTYRSRLYSDLFSNGITGNSAFLDTTTFTIGAGETLDLNQALLPQFLSQGQQAQLRALGTGGHVTDVLTASVPTNAWDQRAATLDLGGLTELDVRAGGKITGAAGATIKTTRLFNEGTIRILGGSILQNATLAEAIATGGLGVRDGSLGGKGLSDVLGGGTLVNGQMQYDENATALVTVGGKTVTNGALFSASGKDRAVFFLGRMDGATGIQLGANSVTDLSGGVVYNPRAGVLLDGTVQRTGTLYAGGTIGTAATYADTTMTLYTEPVYGNGRTKLFRSGASQPIYKQTMGLAFDADKGAAIDVSGGAGTFDIQTGIGSFTATPEWTDAGTVRVMGGGTIGNATIKAVGGSAHATGGVLEWLRPTLQQGYGAAGAADNTIAADWVSASGFTTLKARGALAIDGTVDLKLGKAFLLSSADTTSSTVIDSALQVRVGLVGNGDAVIEAPYVSLSSQSQNAATGGASTATSGSITFKADAIDLVGGLGFAVPTSGGVAFDAAGAVRLIGVASPVQEKNLSGVTGRVLSTGDISFLASQVYATTGTGNLQQYIEAQRNGTTALDTAYVVSSQAADGTIRFARNSTTTPDAPLSAGSWVKVLATHIEQDGVLRAPLGLLELGSAATKTLTFGANSVTSVSGAGLNVPYGTTTDLTEYYYLANVTGALTTAPTGKLTLSGDAITVAKGALIDGTGGGDVFAYEFVSGTGGSRDVLSRFNLDAFSSTNGYQYADGRQVYAILPVSKAGEVAAVDPLYSADYGSGGGDLYGLNAGRTVWLDAAPGIAAGEYLLLPAHYALLPGALRLVENTGAAAPYVSASTTLLDGSVVVGGSYGTAGTSYRDSLRHSFTVESAATFLQYSKLATTSGTTDFNDLATKQGKGAPSSPLDAAAFVIRPGSSLVVDGTFAVDAAKGGKGATIDIPTLAVEITQAAGVTPASGVLQISATTLQNLNADSLLIGGTRSLNADGTTTLSVVGKAITVDSGVSLQVPELLLAAGGSGSAITLGQGVSIKANASSAAQGTGAYVVGAKAPGTANDADATGIGAILRVSSDADRVITRSYADGLGSTDGATLAIGDGVSLGGNSVDFDNSGSVSFGTGLALSAKAVTLGSSTISFGEGGLSSDVVAALASADTLTLRSNNVVTLGAGLPAAFKGLVIDAAGLASGGADATIKAGSVTLTNSGSAAGTCASEGLAGCGAAQTFTIDTGSLALGNGTFTLFGFGEGAVLGASAGVDVTGKGSLALAGGVGDLTIKAPYIADRSTTTTTSTTSGQADYTFATTGHVLIDGTGMSGKASTALATGSLIGFGTAGARVASFDLVNATVRATSGIVNVYSTGDVALGGTAAIEVPGFSTQIGSSSDPITATAGSGTINLQSGAGNIALGAQGALVFDNGTGDAGTLNLIASHGTVQLGSSLNAAIAAGKARGGSLAVNAGSLLGADGNPLDFNAFVAKDAHLLGGTVQIHVGTGDLGVAAGQTWRAASLSLGTDKGTITVAGTIDTSGQNVSGLKMTDAAYTAARVNGGDITLYGADGVTLAGTARLLAGTTGYAAGDSRQASGGKVTLGIASDSAAITTAKGAVIDVAAANTATRLVSESVKDPTTLVLTTAYRQVAGDTGGTVTFRAPVIHGDSQVDLRLGGTITGASQTSVDAFKVYDLDTLVGKGFTGITRAADGSIHLDASVAGANLLADGATAGTVPWFIRQFAITRADGGSLSGYRLRPDVVLKAAGTIALDSNLNLGAGSITNYAGAVADGLLAVSALGPDASGAPRYQVVAGKEADLFARYVDMTYRVGGKVTGEAGVFTFAAGGDLAVNGSITDGYFNFHDKTDAAYINYQLGGGNRVYQPGVVVNCAQGGACDNTLSSYSANAGKVLTDDEIVVIDLTAGKRADQLSAQYVNSPYSASANSAAANGTGNALSSAELFPLVNGKAVHSSDIKLVAGALQGSVDPLTVDGGKTGTVTVSGEKSYRVVASAGTNSIGGGLEIGVTDEFGDVSYGSAGTFLSGTFSGFVDPTTASDLYTRLNWGNKGALSAEALKAAQTFFAGYRFITRNGVVVGVYAPLGLVTQFLAGDYGTKYASLTSINAGTSNPVKFGQPNVYYQPVVRTGDGSIALAAAGDVNLAGSTRVTYRNAAGQNTFASDTSAQVGGAAVYTAGTRLANATAADAEPLNYVPSPQGLTDMAGVLSGNGGSISISAGRDVLARRDVWSETYLNASVQGLTTYDPTRVGDSSQRWRVGTVGTDTTIKVVSQLFTSGVGALAGGDVTVNAGRTVSDLTIALDNGVTTTTNSAGARVLGTTASGNLTVNAGLDLLGGQFDVAQGVGTITVGRAVADAGSTLTTGSYDAVAGSDNRNLLRLRVNDAVVSLTARGDVAIGGIGALGAEQNLAQVADHLNDAGFYSAIAGVSVATAGTIDLVQNRAEQRVAFMDQSATETDRGSLRGYVLPPSLSLSSLSSDLVIGNGNPELLYPSQYGQLQLIAGGDISNYQLAMSDANPSDLPGAFTVSQILIDGASINQVQGLGFNFGVTVGDPNDTESRLLHDRTITHRDDTRPALIYAGGSMSNVELNLAKSAQINAGLDIVDFYFQGQNVNNSDVTTITAGRDITATSSLPSNDLPVRGRPYVGTTNFVLGGPGALMVQAGRNLGPFLNSVTIDNVSYAGGIRTVGNENNPWLGSTGADIYALFGVSFGANYDALRDTYLDPANLAKLDGALFVQNTDSAGNKTPDRGKPVYAPILAAWLQTHAPDAFAAVFGSTTIGAADLPALAYAAYDKLYAAFKTQVPALEQRQFLISKLYFGELAAPADPANVSYQQYVRGYRAIDTLFPASAGYTDNLASYATDPATITADHPLGVPTRKLVNGEPAAATRVLTGNVDLRLATIETSRGGAINILGPGGDFIAGSVVRTSTQAAGKSSPLGADERVALQTGTLVNAGPVAIGAIPIGFEGVLSLRGGSISSFTDGDFRLNQSRLFTLSGGDVTMWSSNGDLNAGQGPKTAANFPPITLRFDTDAFSEVDSAGSVSGAGIAAFKASASDAGSSVILLAPVGTVDAGDAGVRASGDVFVAAARVANADNFKVGGVSVGVPTTAVVAAPALPTSATAATTAAAAAAGSSQNSAASDRRSIIRVDVLGYIGGNDEACASGKFDSQGRCLN